MNNKSLIGSLLVLVLATISGCSAAAPVEDDKIKVVTSFYPLYFFASEIGGDLAQVSNITPAGAEPHDYEPTAQDVAFIQNSKLLILNGGGFEPWGEELKENTELSETLIIGAGEDLISQNDPHVWLSLPLATQMVDRIAEGFSKIDSENQFYYQSNADDLKKNLQELDSRFRNELANCGQKSIVTSHAAFSYLAAAYGLQQMAISGLSPDAEPSAKQLAETVEFAKTNGVKYIFFESLVSPKLAETIANEVGAQTLVLNPIEGLSEGDLAAGKNYLTEMGANLDNLKIALECTK